MTLQEIEKAHEEEENDAMIEARQELKQLQEEK